MTASKASHSPVRKAQAARSEHGPAKCSRNRRLSLAAAMYSWCLTMQTSPRPSKAAFSGVSAMPGRSAPVPSASSSTAALRMPSRKLSSGPCKTRRWEIRKTRTRYSDRSLRGMVLDGLSRQVEEAIANGAKVLTGGKRAERTGFFYEPTVLAGVTPDTQPSIRVLRAVAQLFIAEDDDAIVSLANDSKFGLGGTIYSTNIPRARALASRIETGMVFINTPTTSRPELPFGGIKRSGYGRELGDVGHQGIRQPEAGRYCQRMIGDRRPGRVPRPIPTPTRHLIIFVSCSNHQRKISCPRHIQARALPMQPTLPH